MGVGSALFDGGSKLLDNPLGVVRIGFKGYALGKTTADTLIKVDQDIKDIMYQQEGTKPADKVRTGILYILEATFGEIKTGLLAELQSGISTSKPVTGDAGTIGRQMFQSMKTNDVGALRIAAVDENGLALATVSNVMDFYEAVPIIDSDLINWGVDTQRNLPVKFCIFWHEFAGGESSTKDGAFGYWGDPTLEDVPAIVWPSAGGPEFVSATFDSATNITITFDEIVTSLGAAGKVVANVEGVFVLATGVAINADTTKVDATFPAATFTTGDVVTVSIADSLAIDADTNGNSEVNDRVVVDGI